MTRVKAFSAEQNPEYADAMLCPRLTALRELYGLLVSCRRNGGKATCHPFRNVDAALVQALEVAAKNDHFDFEAQPIAGDRVMVTVSWRGE